MCTNQFCSKAQNVYLFFTLNIYNLKLFFTDKLSF
ncbi:hypothetical protein CLOLEP_02180 [[Clostridium] leptum DSM 753]|uniref:Uncharacterized protein n=1 Tax=[Clostridium] leptum DSM 753 TaxID=428125 RepID=A7VUD4_9FIRM|nr:hypothetical protein CLOLEP_02180 [[Clostridium] leptum DSM 753]